MRGRLRKPFVIIAIGAVLAGSGVYGYGKVTGTQSANAANAWVNVTGQTCTRSATPVTFQEASDAGHLCSSFQAAAAAASAGDLVYVKGGTYSSQTVTASKTSPGVTIQEAPGESALIGGLTLSGADWITVKDFTTTVTSDPDLLANEQNQGGVAVMWNDPDPATHDTVENMDASNFFVWNANYITIKGGDYGQCYLEPSITGSANDCVSKIDAGVNTHDVTVDGVVLHDYWYSQGCFDIPGADCHHECLYVNAFSNFTFKNNEVYNCEQHDLFMTENGPDATAGWDNTLIENNWFGPSFQGTSYGCTSDCQNAKALVLGHCEYSVAGDGYDYNGLTVRFNSVSQYGNIGHDPSAPCSVNNAVIYGNIMGKVNCNESSEFTNSYNVYIDNSTTGDGSGTCGTNGVSVASAPYVTANLTSINYHLSGAAGSTSADNLVPTSVGSGCPAFDWLAETSRPQGTNCDAGADER